MTALTDHRRKPVPTSELADWLPHRPPMVWIDDVVQCDDDIGECTVRLKDDGLYFSEEGLRATSLVEFIAQSFGYISACRSRESGETRKTSKAFLVSIGSAEFGDSTQVRAGDVLRVRISNVKRIGPITLFDGQVLLASGSVLGKASLKVYAE